MKINLFQVSSERERERERVKSGAQAIKVVLTSLIASFLCVGVIYAATTIGNNITTGGTITSTSINTFYGATSIGGALTATSTLTVSGNAVFDTDTLYVDATNNRVGIGTTTPQYALDVIGEINISENIRFHDVMYPTITLGPVAQELMIYKYNEGFQKVRIGDDIMRIYDAVGDEEIRINASGDSFISGNTSIGTSTLPSTELMVHGSATTTVSVLSGGGALKGGRIILEDSDGAGCTEIYALNGVLTSAIVACPSN